MPSQSRLAAVVASTDTASPEAARVHGPDAPPPAADAWSMRRPARVGAIAMILFFGIIGTWSWFARIDGAVVATGFVKVAGNRKTVQHIDGGTIRELMVQEGQKVAAGQVLLTLDDTQIIATVASLAGALDVMLATESRLRSERDDHPEVRFATALEARAGMPDVAEAMANQRAIFDARQEAKRGEVAVLEQRKEQLRRQIEGVGAQMVSQRRQAALTRQELEATRALHREGFATLNRVLALDRGYAQYEGQESQYRAEIARLEQALAEASLQVAQVRKTQMMEVTRELGEVQARILETRERLNSARDVLARVSIQSPIEGHVVGLSVFTIGGVINRGDKILDVVPADGELVVEAMIRPEDIESVVAGAGAEVVITAFKHSDMLKMEGSVRSVSADRLTDPKTGASFFSAIVEIGAAAVPRDRAPRIAAGMPAEVFIKTAERSVLDYLVSPLTASMRHALRER